MPCSEEHLIPISSAVNPNWPDPAPAPPPKKQWGGRRKGAGAPKGNLNAFRHGKYSTQHKKLTELLAQFPDAEVALVKLALARRKFDKQKQDGAALILAELLRRLGEILLHPGDNHLELNQELLSTIRQLEALVREIPQNAIKIAPSVNQDPRPTRANRT